MAAACFGRDPAWVSVRNRLSCLICRIPLRDAHAYPPSGCPMPAVTKCLKCRTEVSLAGHKSNTAVTCPKCGMRWVPIEGAWADEPAAEEPADLDSIEPADE